jgi:hypothetical protein
LIDSPVIVENSPMLNMAGASLGLDGDRPSVRSIRSPATGESTGKAETRKQKPETNRRHFLLSDFSFLLSWFSSGATGLARVVI